MLIKPINGLSLVKPPHEIPILQDGTCKTPECQNFVVRDKKLSAIGGTSEYNATALAEKITWVNRSYHKKGDGTFAKVVFCFSNGKVYAGDEVAGTLTEVLAGFTANAIPLHATMQVSGNSLLYLYIGNLLTDEVWRYNGNVANVWEKTTLNEDLGRAIEGGVVHLDRMWYWSVNSSIITYSTNLLPEDLSTDAADIIVGQETDSVVRKIILGANETLYIFKNQSIWQLFGRTPSTFQFRKITDKYGLASKRTVTPVGSGFIFMNEFDKELYFFGGTESSIRPMTEEDIRLRDIIDPTKIDWFDMVVHDGLFRFAFKHTGDNIYQNRELIYALNEPHGELPKWSMVRGSKVSCYSVWNQQGDRNELVTGRSDTGKLMYHGRTTSFDGTAIEYIMRTPDIVASEDKVVRFKGFFIKGKPGGKSLATLEYLLNARFSTAGTGDWDWWGERRKLAGIEIPTQAMFNNRIIPLHRYSLGNSIAFKFTYSDDETGCEIYSIAFKAQERYPIRNSLVSTENT